tara:strand:- start:1077 stop:1979 length:903 start_codon:yes stop_codon:yes gene_type:complete
MAEIENITYKPLVSIIVNCFNGEKFLKEALASISNQTYNNWELIFWDNKSTDNSKKIFFEFNDKRFKYYLAEKHTSLYEARNNAIQESQGEIIAFLDVDDWWKKDKLQKQIVLFKDKNIGLVYSNCYLFFENKKKRKIFKREILKTGYITKYLFKTHSVGLLTVLLRKEAYNSVSGFNNAYSIIGDFDMKIRLSLKWKFDCVQEPLAYYRIHDKNFSSTHNSLEIDEFENWISNKEINSNNNLRPYLHYINQKITFLKTIKNINDGKLVKAIKNIILFPIGLNKIKLLLYILLPKRFINK